MEKIYSILAKLRPEINFKEAFNFIADDVLDSLDIIKLVVALEEEFLISIETEDIVPENFENVENISKLIKRLGGKL
jgi:acyl carrier protein